MPNARTPAAGANAEATTVRFVDPDRFAALQATGKLPSPKGVALAIIRLLQRDDFRVADLVQLVQSDPAIAARLLYFANVAAFGRPRPIISLPRAVVALGSYRIRDLVIGLSVMHDHKSGTCAAFDYDRFWAHSLATGIACQELARYAQIASEELFTIGLLARVGELALATLYTDDYAAILVAARASGADVVTLERERFGMDRHQLAATLFAEWGLPEVLIQAAYHHENPDAAGFADGSRAQTLTHCLSFASALAELCTVDEEARWSLLPALLARAARLGVGGDALNDIVDRMVKRWHEWGRQLQVRTQDLPPFAEILAQTPPLRRMGRASDHQKPRARPPRLAVQLVGIDADELPALLQQIEDLDHLAALVEVHEIGVLLRQPAPVVIADTAAPGFAAVDFCRQLRRTPAGRECYLLILATPDEDLDACVDAGADDVIVKPLDAQTLRVHLNTAARLLTLRDEIHRERIGIMRSTDEFASAQKRLLQDALTDPLTQLPNRRNGLDFLASEWNFARASNAPLSCLVMDVDHFKAVNDGHGHAAGDAILRQLAELLKRTARSEDMVFRHGGEEFVAILPNAGLPAALQIGERLRALVEASDFLWREQRIPVTVSVGAAMSRADQATSLALLEAADAALYRAKDGGRNRVVGADSA